MSLKCPSCGMDNPDDSYWCMNCNHKLIRDVAEVENKEIGSVDKVDENAGEQLSDLVWDKKPRVSSKIKLGVVVLICIIIIFASLYFIFPMFSNVEGRSAEFGVDFWFEDNMIKTTDGWSFEITELTEYALDGMVLGMKSYYMDDFPYRAENYFSPVDLYIGVEDILVNPNDYPYIISSFSNRQCNINFLGEGITNRLNFDIYSDNYHIIPQNQEVFNQLSNISIEDHVLLEGNLVNINGSRSDEVYEWMSFEENNQNKILLIDSFFIE